MHLRTVPGHADRVRAMQWYNDSTLISCSWEQAIKASKVPSQQHLSSSFHQLWDPDTLNCKHQINSGHTSFVYDIDIQGEELLSCSADRTVKLWDLNKEGAHVHTFATSDSNDDDWVLSVRWHPDKNTILWFVYPHSLTKLTDLIVARVMVSFASGTRGLLILYIYLNSHQLLSRTTMYGVWLLWYLYLYLLPPSFIHFIIPLYPRITN